MTVSTEVNHNEYTGNGVTTSFPYTFRIFHASDLVVTTSDTNGVLRTLTLNTDYTVTGVGSYSGGAVVLPLPLANAWAISIERSLPVVQETDLRNQGKFFAETHEGAFDYLTMLIQQCFGWLRLALLKPNFLAKYYDAKQNRIANLADPIGAKDAVNYKTALDLSAGGASQAILAILADTNHIDNGDALVGVKQPFTGSVPETQHNVNAKRIDSLNAGAIGDAIADDTAAFNILEAQNEYTVIDGLWRTYLVTTYPTRHRYINATFLIAGKTVRGNGYFYGRTGGTNTVIGDGAAPDLPVNPATSSGTANVAIGEEAMKSALTVRSSIAIGLRAMRNAKSGKYNIGVGLESLYYVDGDGSDFGGTRNVMFGDNSGRFITTGYQNIGIGRNTAQGITTGNNNLAAGTNAMAGRGSLKFKDSQYIQNVTPITVERCTALGSNALYFGAGDGSSGTGERALGNAKKDSANCSAYGASALLALGAATSIDGKVSVDDGRTGTYSMTASGITFTLASHGLTTGFGVIVSLTSGVPYIDYQYYSITVVDANTFTVSEPEGIVTSGNFKLISYSTLANQVASISNSAFGAGAMYNVLYGSENLAIGVNAMPVNTGGNQNVSVGNLTMSYAVNSSQCVAIGYRALRTMMDGSQAVSMTNCIGIGENARVSGNNQMQLGNAAITVYTQTAIQTRSDERDKTDKREIPGDLAVAFVRGLVPHFYKYDFRDDYIEEYDEEIGVDARGNAIVEHRTRMLEKDGSKKRIRDHAGFIAQQVKELMDKLGIDFGMYQDHLVNGGCDVKTLAYEQTIPFLTKAFDVAFERMDAQDLVIAEQNKTLTALENKLKRLEEKLENI